VVLQLVAHALIPHFQVQQVVHQERVEEHELARQRAEAEAAAKKERERLEAEARAKAEAEGPFVIDQGAIRSAYETWTTAVGWRWVTPHVMRHSWATIAARRGVSMWEIAGVLGDDEKTVRTHYLHHAPGHLRAAVNRTHQPMTGVAGVAGGAARGRYARPGTTSGRAR
jgi:hypothetical protein